MVGRRPRTSSTPWLSSLPTLDSAEPQAQAQPRCARRQFGHVKARYRGLKKNTAQLMTLFALSNLWMARRSLLGVPG